MPIQYVVPCTDCQLDTILPQRVLEEIIPSLAASPTGTETLDFVCPHCGKGYRHLIAGFRTVETLYPHQEQHDLPMFHVSLRCERESCISHARVHTIAASETASTMPLKPLSEWKLHGITCFDGHRVKEQLQAVSIEPMPLDHDEET